MTHQFENADYGADIKQFRFVFITISDDQAETEKFYKSNNEIGVYTNRFDKTKIKYVSMAFAFSPEKIDGISEDENRKALYDTMMRRIEPPDIRFPKSFDYHSFSMKLKECAAILREARFEAE